MNINYPFWTKRNMVHVLGSIYVHWHKSSIIVEIPLLQAIHHKLQNICHKHVVNELQQVDKWMLKHLLVECPRRRWLPLLLNTILSFPFLSLSRWLEEEKMPMFSSYLWKWQNITKDRSKVLVHKNITQLMTT